MGPAQKPFAMRRGVAATVMVAIGFLAAGGERPRAQEPHADGFIYLATLDDHPGCEADFCDVVHMMWRGTVTTPFVRLRNFLPEFRPVPSPDGGRILYAERTRSDREGDTVAVRLIVRAVDWTLREPVGEPQVLMSHIDVSDSKPLGYVWAPNGRDVAILSMRRRRAALWVIDPIGSRRLPTSCAPRAHADAALAWSSTGNIAFVAGYGRHTGKGELPASAIYRVAAEGAQRCRLVTRPPKPWRRDGDPAWSPDGNNLAFVRARRVKDHLMIMQGGRQTPLAARSPATG
jgi:hypothetical protein